MLNLFQHLKESIGYETLNPVQDDKSITTQSPWGRGLRRECGRAVEVMGEVSAHV
jgi:hypothetical protein